MAEQEKPEGGLKEIFTSLTIAFAMALAFRGFVVEGFVIPTGSMAPTLLGMHVRFQAPETGENWSVGPKDYMEFPNDSVPMKTQGRADKGAVKVDVPGTGSPLDGGIQPLQLTRGDVPRRSGDRIFVLKYLYQVFNPNRFDVVVFKNPTNPYENYIKRLIGLPSEQIALVDGDVFTRPAELANGPNPWEGEGWRIGRKDERVQRDLWYPVFDSRFTPLNPPNPFTSPWLGDGWDFSGDGVYRQDSAASSRLVWDSERWPITDYVHYNDKPQEPPRLAFGPMNTGDQTAVLPCSDIRTLVALRPDGEGLTASATLRTRGHVFRARVSGDEALLEMRADQDGAAWTELDRQAVSLAIDPSTITTIEFWHVDQALYLFLDGKRVAGGAEAGAYDWNPAQRVSYATGLGMVEILQKPTVLNDAQQYTRAQLGWSFEGSALTVHRAGIWRDLFYQPAVYAGRRVPVEGLPSRATHPSKVVTLGPDEFFVCGDNSAKSQDSRLMSTIDPWVEAEFELQSPGIVPRELLIGKAFFVYFPSLQWRGKIPVPDFGRMRFIR